MDYPPNQRNPVRRAYILKKPCLPKTHNFPQRQCSRKRCFSVKWFNKRDWLEYSISKDAAFCFVCYLFKHEVENNYGGDAFVNGGFRAWNKPERFDKHVSGVNSAHNVAYERGQGYDGASNMKGEINGLKALIMNDTSSAYYIHCFAHQLQLTLVAVAKKNDNCGWVFEITTNLLNVIGASCKRREMIRKSQAQKVAQALEMGEIDSGSGLKEQDIVNTMRLVSSTMKVLQKMREQGWDILLKKVTSFCNKHKIDVPNMEANYVPHGRSRSFVEKATNEHHFRVGIFLEVIDLYLQELDNRFDEKNMELLTCMSSLSPKYNFSSFDKEKVLASLYPEDFSHNELLSFDDQLEVFKQVMLDDGNF
ncbi:uncharacterized protein LOC110700082 [Chenopodium quinoa]|uniref:uncharacterized protein LOC110700082 n=1 Tax=Chenopodium quinoa TaxID=63459 RepID=UPI000B787216|nr:uncharacterized protein LOC110700082 [Chenopodium quinoa]